MEKKEEKEEKIPHMCVSIGHRPLRGRCPKSAIALVMSLRTKYEIKHPIHTEWDKYGNSLLQYIKNDWIRWGNPSLTIRSRLALGTVS